MVLLNFRNQIRRRDDSLLGLTAEEKQKAAEQSATGKRINLKIGSETTRNQFSEQFAGPYFQRLEYEPLENGQHER